VKNPRMQVLKELFLEYQKAPCRNTFERILKRVDNFILYMIKEIRRSRPYLRNVDSGDLYQVGILGIYDVANRITSEDDCSMIPAMMKFCIRRAVSRFYGCYRKEVVKSGPCESACEDILELDFDSFEEEICKRDDLALLFRHISRLMTEGDISREDVVLIRRRMILGEHLNVLAKDLGVSGQTVLNRVKRLKEKILSSIAKERLDMRVRRSGVRSKEGKIIIRDDF